MRKSNAQIKCTNQMVSQMIPIASCFYTFFFSPMQFAHGLYDHIMTAGKPLGITNAGCFCVDSLRIEKGYPRMGIELTAFVTPYQAGLENRIDLRKVRILLLFRPTLYFYLSLVYMSF